MSEYYEVTLDYLIQGKEKVESTNNVFLVDGLSLSDFEKELAIEVIKNSRLELDRKVHELKLSDEFFDHVRIGKKNFEIRRNDRNYRVGDHLLLKEWNGVRYTGRTLLRKIVYITDYDQKDNTVVMGIKKVI